MGVVNIGGTIALVILLRGRLGRLDGGRITASVLKICTASAAVAVVAYVVWRPLDSTLGRSFPAQVVSLGFALAASVATYLIACRVLKVREMQALLSLRGRLRRG